MKKAKQVLRGLAFTLAIVMGISATPLFFAAGNRTTSETELFCSGKADGVRFEKGVNREVNVKSKFDSSISNVKIYKTIDNYRVEFAFGSEVFRIDADLVNARKNNVGNDHYLFAPIGFSHTRYSLLNIKLTTNANKIDLLPANEELIGKTVLTVIVKEKATTDVLYWQTELSARSNRNVSLTTTTEDDAIARANEYYYMTSAKSIEDVWEEDTDNKKVYADRETYEEYKNRQHETKANLYDDNPYYYLGIPNSSFKTVTNKWQWLGVGVMPGTNKYLPIRYYAYSYSEAGAPNNVYTHIMIIGSVDEMPTQNKGAVPRHTRVVCSSLR